MTQPGILLDQHDDLDLAVIRKQFPDGQVPELLKRAHILDSDQLDTLPNHSFALCAMTDHGLMRKYAIIDPAMTALSTVYFLANKDQLPVVAQKVAAANLVEACGFHDIQPPAPLLKLAGDVHPAPYIDITGLVAPVKIAAAEDFRLDSQEKTAAACEYFDVEHRDWHPRERHRLATSLLKAAKANNVNANEAVRRYGSETYGPSLKLGYISRKGVLKSEEEQKLLDDVYAQARNTQPEKFAEVLAELDQGLGLDRHWDKPWGVLDPWASTFGEMKVAEYTYVHGNDRVTASQLLSLAQNPLLLNERFTVEIVTAFKQNPVAIFDSLPLPDKQVIMRIATDTHTGGANHRTGGA